jgi:hypothetical protein
MTRSHAFLGTAHLLGNALLLWLGYTWLGMSEADGPHLAGSAAVLLVFCLGALWLHATALAFFGRDSASNFRTAAFMALRRLPQLFVLAVIVTLVYGLLSYCYGAFDHTAFVIGSAGTMTLRRPVPPARVLAGFHALIWLLRWIVVPALALPLAARIVEGRSSRLSRRWPYWLAVGALLLSAVWVPLRLLDWIPNVNAFGTEAVSFAIRIGLGYLLFVAALLTLEFFTSSGSPRPSQPSTVVSP